MIEINVSLQTLIISKFQMSFVKKCRFFVTSVVKIPEG